ncbi:MAG: peptidylprolyl isomerase [Spirochaetes bacterium]|nr:peptidylprolyl isomerase [Spirochaetota bacterium]
MKTAFKPLLAALLLASAVFGASAQAGEPGRDAAGTLPDGLYARIRTERGDIVARLEYGKAPLTVCNFAGLAEGSIPSSRGGRFYDGLTFHRVEPGFVIQGGDPAGDGSGGPGFRFADEFDPSLRHDGPGMLSMANSGPETNGSQFFITLGPAPWLDDLHSVFGRVVSGQDVAESIRPGDAIVSVDIIRVGEAARAFRTDRTAWNGLRATAARRAMDRIELQYPELADIGSGLRSVVLGEGTGPTPSPGSMVAVEYELRLPSGRLVDRSDGAPLEFGLDSRSVIPGFETAVKAMRKGERRLVVIPPMLAYGARGVPGVIPPNSPLVFTIVLTDFR